MAEIISLPDGYMTAVSYLIVLDKMTVLIDPTAPTGRLPQGLPPIGLILATHGHIDHIDRADAWRDITGAGLSIHRLDSDCLTNPVRNLSAWLGGARSFRPAENTLEEAQICVSDQAYQIEVWHTPGHTAGSCCFLLTQNEKAEALFTGDTLFCGSIGRTDLGGDDNQMNASLKRLFRWARNNHLTEESDLSVYPGHGASTSLLHEIRTNPFLKG